MGRSLNQIATLFLTTVFLFAGASLFSANAGGCAVVNGRVMDAFSGESLEGVMLALVEDSGHRARTDSEGLYALEPVEEGIYTIRIFKAGYEPLDVPGVRVQSGQPLSIEIPLLSRSATPAGPAFQELSPVQVRADLILDPEVTLRPRSPVASLR